MSRLFNFQITQQSQQHVNALKIKSLCHMSHCPFKNAPHLRGGGAAAGVCNKISVRKKGVTCISK